MPTNAMMLSGAPPLGGAGSYKTITIPEAKIGTTNISPGFTATLAGTFTYLKDFGHGGSIASVNNVAFYADTGFTTLLGFEREKHDLTTGAVIYHFKSAATLSATVDTIAGYMRLDETGGNLAGNAWRTACKRRWGLGDGSTLSLVDSTGNGSALTNVSSVVAAAGILNGGATFNGTTSYLTEAAAAVSAEPMAFCCWAKSAASAAQVLIAIAKKSANDQYMSVLNYGASRLNNYRQANNGVNVAHPLNSTTSAWHFYVSNLYDVDNADGFQDGVQLTLSVTSNSVPSGLTDTFIGAYVFSGSTVGGVFSGDLSEPRIYSETLAPSEVLAMYNNQNDPATFCVVT